MVLNVFFFFIANNFGFQAMSNELMMQSEDFMNAVIAQMSKEEGKFDKL